MRFFVAKVNLTEQATLGFSYLRPLQVAYESPKFMLPIRLGMVNADGPQELFVYALHAQGRVETTNYRTVKLPTGMDLPPYVKQEFPAFYRAMFDRAGARARTCARCSSSTPGTWAGAIRAPPTRCRVTQLRALGVFWLDADRDALMRDRGGAADVFVTRLHLRYDAAHFPEDLVFQETADRTNFQGRYVLRHPWTGTGDLRGGASVSQHSASPVRPRSTDPGFIDGLAGR